VPSHFTHNSPRSSIQSGSQLVSTAHWHYGEAAAVRPLTIFNVTQSRELLLRTRLQTRSSAKGSGRFATALERCAVRWTWCLTHAILSPRVTAHTAPLKQFIKPAAPGHAVPRCSSVACSNYSGLVRSPRALCSGYGQPAHAHNTHRSTLSRRTGRLDSQFWVPGNHLT
jgi:hypothetical protein